MICRRFWPRSTAWAASPASRASADRVTRLASRISGLGRSSSARSGHAGGPARRCRLSAVLILTPDRLGDALTLRRQNIQPAAAWRQLLLACSSSSTPPLCVRRRTVPIRAPARGVTTDPPLCVRRRTVPIHVPPRWRLETPMARVVSARRIWRSRSATWSPSSATRCALPPQPI
jgi:hypothetical protein